MIKDLLKTMLAINNDTNLNTSEKCLLSSLILYYNTSIGYAYPTYDELKIALSTKRNETVSKYIKSLSEKGYISVKKVKGNKSIYFINKYLFFVSSEAKEQPKAEAKKVQAAPVDSSGNHPIENQIHVDEIISEPNSKVIEISKYTGFTAEQSEELLKESGNDAAKVINAFDFVKAKKKADNPFNYTKWAAKKGMKLVEVKIKKQYSSQSSTVSKFNNFEAREYNYNDLEKALLGWEEPKTIEEYRIYN